MNVVCIGSGYVGSVTGAAFAVLGNQTTVIDLDQNKVTLMNSGKSPIYEPGLDDLISINIGKTLFATTSYDVIKNADVVFIGVGTPSLEDGTADLKFIKSAAKSIGEHLNADKFTVIVDKSTVPVGTADIVTSIIEKESGLTSGVHFAVVSNPEFLREGYALEDVFYPDRVIIGSMDSQASGLMRDLYKPLINRENYEKLEKGFSFDFNPETPKAKWFETDTKSAEMIKYAANAFLAVKISFINEVARLCETLGANALDVAKGIGMDTRIGNKFLEVSSGWSGSCFPKDTAEILATSQKSGSELSIVKAAVDSNYRMQQYVVEKIENRLGTLKGKKIGILGLTFKPNTDDARKTQASVIIDLLNSKGASVSANDPQGMVMFKVLNANLDISYCDLPEEVANNADALLLLTHWDLYKFIDWSYMFKLMNTDSAYILDTRNFLDKNALQGLGYIYEGLGTSSIESLKKEQLFIY